LSAIPWLTQFPDAPVWLIWLAVAVLGILRKRRIAAVGAWLGVAGFFWAPSWPAGLGRVPGAGPRWCSRCPLCQ
jgi:hypothetical protein